ncbi:MAG: phosphate ABC transporter permease subunit PstC [Chitinophagales bacterium]|nr:phosphate ABC transporter permease subunit PstC [Chitinophagales bacterium]MDW8428419.1 phosphate ABC transporter permease subunit PstC [Chitinophagales bacterium]
MQLFKEVGQAIAGESKIQKKRRLPYLTDTLVRAILFLCSLVSVFTTLAILAVLVVQSYYFFREVSIIEFLTSKQWTPLFAEKHFGILPLLCGTLLTSLIALLVSVPLGLAVAVYLSEYARRPIRKVIKPFLEILAGIPTIVYGYFALLTITPLLQKLIPGLGGFNALSPGIVMGIMILPLVTSLSEDALRAVPDSLREGGFALGASKLQVSLTIVFPSALSGIMASIILALSRAVGETMIVAIAAGNLPQLTWNPLEPVSTMTAYIVQVSQGDTPYGSLAYNTIFAVAIALFVLTFILNMISFRIRKTFMAIGGGN